MDTTAAATASGDAINGLGTHFMLDMETYVYGAGLGFQGSTFYVAGRGGCLGDVPAGVVAAAFIFFEPGYIAKAWEQTAGLLSRRQAAEEFAGAGHRWAEAHIPDDVDAARLAELAGRIGDAASPSGAPLFAGWRSLPEPPSERPKAVALHRINALRELRGALHGASVLASGISPHDAVARRTPYMLTVFGWPELTREEVRSIKDVVTEPWSGAQDATERVMGRAYESLSESERGEFVELVNATQAAVTAG